MVGLSLACVLVAFAPERDDVAAPEASDLRGLDGELLALAPRERRPLSPDLKDPFPPKPPELESVPFRSTAAVDLKDPFDPPREPGPRVSIRSDLLDPFTAEVERESPRSCSPEATAEGTPIQRPRSLERRRPCKRTAPPLRDPFAEDAD